MKAFLALAILMSLLVYAACGGNDGAVLTDDSGEGTGILSDEPQADSDTVILPEESEANIIAIAKEITQGQIPESEGEVSFSIDYYRPDKGRARVIIVGVFFDDGQWLEKEAELSLAQNVQGKWEKLTFPGDPVGVFFELTSEEQRLQDKIQRDQDRQGLVQSQIEDLTAKKEAFENIVITVGEPVGIPKEHRPGTGIEGVKFPVTIDNPTSQPHRVYYTVKWTQTTFSATTGGCDPNKLPRETYETDTQDEIEVPAFGKIDEEVKTTSVFFLTICIDGEFSNQYAVIEKIDGHTLENVDSNLSQLQTLP